MKNRIVTRLTLMLLALGLASPALAVDGVLEINETCAQAGCFNGDSPGWPVTIFRAGSYRLTSNLNVPDENTDGIVVSADHISIDLNGFAIIGPVTCSGNPLTCSHASGTGSGIESTGTNIRATSVRNGSVTGMGNYGVYLGERAEVTNLRIRSNRIDGIYVWAGSIVSGNIADQNGEDGISVPNGTVSGNTVTSNGDDGIFASVSTVSGNTACYNDGDGIKLQTGALVSGNTVRLNSGYGLNFTGTGSAYSGNVITNNTAGTVNSGINMGGNSCNATPTCP